MHFLLSLKEKFNFFPNIEPSQNSLYVCVWILLTQEKELDQYLPYCVCAFSLVAFFYGKMSEFLSINCNCILKQKFNPHTAFERNSLSTKDQHRFYGYDSHLEVGHICFRHDVDMYTFLP